MREITTTQVETSRLTTYELRMADFIEWLESKGIATEGRKIRVHMYAGDLHEVDDSSPVYIEISDESDDTFTAQRENV